MSSNEMIDRDTLINALHDVSKQYAPHTSDYLIQRFADRIVHELEKQRADKETEQPCQDEGCPHYTTAIKCQPKEGGCIATVARQPDEIPQKMSVDRLMEAIEAVTQIRLMVWRQNAQGEGFGCIKEFGEDIILALHELISRREAMERESSKDNAIRSLCGQLREAIGFIGADEYPAAIAEMEHAISEGQEVLEQGRKS